MMLFQTCILQGYGVCTTDITDGSLSDAAANWEPGVSIEEVTMPMSSTEEAKYLPLITRHDDLGQKLMAIIYIHRIMD